MSQDDKILQTFFLVLSKYVELNNLSSVKEFFTLSESNKIDKAEFGKGLLKLGYENNSVQYEFLMKKYQNFHVDTLINLNVIIQEFENYDNNAKSNLKSNLNPNSNLTSPDLEFKTANTHFANNDANFNSNTGFRINEGTPKSVLETSNNGFGVTKYLNTPSNFGNTGIIGKLTNENTTQKNIFIEENDEFNISSGRRNPNRYAKTANNLKDQKPISLREDDYDNNNTTGKNFSSRILRSNEILSEESFNNPSINSRPPTFGETSKNNVNPIMEKLEALNKKMMSELQENHSYIKVSLYEKFHNFYLTQKGEMEKELKKLDKNSEKFLTEELFEDFLETCLVLNEDEMKILMMDIVRNNSGKYSYEDFLEKVKNFDKNEILNQIKNYNLNYNDYIVAIRKHIKENKVDVKKNWIDVFQSVPKADLNGFTKLLKLIGLNFSTEEVDYIFNKISDDGMVIIYKHLDNVMNRNPPSLESVKKSQMEKLTGTNFKSNENNFNSSENNFNSNKNVNSNINSNMNLNSIVSSKSSVRDDEYFREITNKNAHESSTIISQRLDLINKKILDILTQMQIFKTFNLYENLNMIFKSLGNLPENYFLQMDTRKQGYLTETEFNMVLTYLKIDLNDEYRNLIFQSISNKTTTHYSYKEFITRVTSYKSIEKNELTRKAHQFFNDYVVDLRSYLKENNININASLEKLFNKAASVNFDQFVKFLQNVNFNLSHNEEYKYLFQILSDDNMIISLISFSDLMILSPPDLKSFIESGSLKSKEKSDLSWKNKLINFTDEFAKTYQKNFQHLFNIFKDINIKTKKSNNEDLVAYFENCFVTPNGEVDKAFFINILVKMGIVRDSMFHNLLQTFTNQKTDMFNLVGFINGYFSFYNKGRGGSSEETADNNKNPNSTPQNNSSTKTIPPNNVAFKNNKREFSQDDMEYIEEVTKSVINIILEEKLLGVKEFFEKKDTKRVQYFTKAEFVKILYEDLDIDTEGQEGNLQIFYDYLINDKPEENKKLGFEPIKIEKILFVFKSFAEDGIELKNPQIKNNFSNTQNKSSSQREEKICSELARYLNNNRIKFVSIFPLLNDKPQESSIQIFDFKQAITLSGFPIAHDDVEMLINYFDPYNKMRISLDNIKSKIIQYEPDYFDKPFQKIDQGRISQISKEFNNNPHISSILNKLNDYIQNNKLTLGEFFHKLDKNENDSLSKSEFVQMMINLDDKFIIEDLVEVFSFIDKENNNYISINKFYAYFNSAFMTSEEKKGRIKISERMKLEVDSLFDHFDKDHDNKISRDDFYQALKSMNNRTTMEDVNIIMKQVDRDGNDCVDRQEFMSVMEETLKQQIVFKEEEKEYFIKLFKEEDIDKVCYLTPIQMKHLLIEKLNCNLTDGEVEELINEVDANNDGMIDIDEFIKLLGSAENNESLKHTVRQINLKRKINPMTFLSIFSGLPMNYFPSFIKDEQKLFKLLPSATLRPRTDPTGILFEDILPLSNGSNGNNNTNAKDSFILRPISTRINTKISFETATGVSIPDENVLSRKDNIIGRILKIVLFNANQDQFLGNSVSIQANWNKDYEDRWYFQEDRKMFNNNIIIRYNGSDYEFISVIIEFIILIKKENIVTETSCGWSSIELKDLIKASEVKLQIKGGSPNKNDTISKSDIRTKRSGWAKFAQFFSGDVKSQLPIKIKPFKELNNTDKNLIDYLPSCIVIHRAAIHMCVIYRKFIAKQILNNQFYSLKVIKMQHSIINNFCKIVDCTDAFKPMIELWNQIVCEGATNTEKKDENYWEFNLMDFVNKIYTVLYSDKFLYNEIDPTKLSLGDDALNSMRNLLINSAIKFDKGKKFNKNNVIEPVENLTSFKPFTIDECIGKKIDICSKLDEILPVNERSVSYDFNKSAFD